MRDPEFGRDEPLRFECCTLRLRYDPGNVRRTRGHCERCRCASVISNSYTFSQRQGEPTGSVTTWEGERLSLVTSIHPGCEPARNFAPGANELYADFPLDRITPKALKVLRERKAKLNLPEAANGRVRVIKRLFAWAVENEEVESNPARGLLRVKNQSQGWHTWTSEELAKFEATRPVGSKARLALAILQFVAVRRSGVVRLGRQHVRDGRIKFTATKNERRKPVIVDMPMSPELPSIIERSPTGDLTFLVTERGVPLTRFGFGN